MIPVIFMFFFASATEKGIFHQNKRDIPRWLTHSEKVLNCTVSAVSRIRMPSARYGHSSTFYRDAIFIFGGRVVNLSDDQSTDEDKHEAHEIQNKRTASKDSWMYNITTNQWKILEFHQEYYMPRVYASAFMYDEKFHIVGGRVDSIRPSHGLRSVSQEIPERIDVFNLRTMQWDEPKKFQVFSSYFPSASGTGVFMPTSRNTNDPLLFLLGGYKSDTLVSPSPREKKRMDLKSKSLSSVITKKYGYYAFHPRNLTQAHIFSAFDALPVFGHQMLTGPDNSLLVIGGYQRSTERNTESKGNFERMIASNKVHVLRPNVSISTMGMKENTSWRTWNFPSMKQPRAHFCALHIAADVEGGIGQEKTEVILVYGGTSENNPDETVNSVEFFDLNNPDGWHNIPMEANYTTPSHASIAHLTEKRYNDRNSFHPIHRVAISGGVSARHGYHRDLIIFDLKFRERQDKFTGSQIGKILRQMISIETLFFIVIFFSGLLLAIGQKFGAERKFKSGFDLTDDRFFSNQKGIFHPGVVLPHHASSITASQTMQIAQENVHGDHIGTSYFESVSTIDSLNTDGSFDRSNQSWISRYPGFPNNRIPPQHNASQISQLSMPTANISISSAQGIDISSLDTMAISNNSNLQYPYASELSPHVPDKKNTNTNIYSDYQLIKEIGKGDDSTVYTAVLGTGELVAVKVIHDTNTKNQASTKDHQYYPFTHEAQIILSIPSQENLIQFYAIFHHREKNEIHIVMELIEAGSLHSLLTKITTPLSLTTIRNYTKDLVQGLSHLHANNIVHCDVKGENVLIGRDGQLKLTDFGQSRRLSTTLPRDDGDCTFAGDVFLLACTIIEILNRGADFISTLNISHFASPHCEDHQIHANVSELSHTRKIHCSCCPCLLHYENFLKEQSENMEQSTDPDFFPFELPESVDLLLLDFLRQCLRLHDRPTIDELRTHPFLEDSILGGGREESVDTDEIPQFTSPRGETTENCSKSLRETAKVEFSNSLDCNIYDF